MFLDFIDDPEVKGVIIATVTYTHEFFVKKCIEAKKTIFCEKPIAESLKDTGKKINHKNSCKNSSLKF